MTPDHLALLFPPEPVYPGCALLTELTVHRPFLERLLNEVRGGSRAAHDLGADRVLFMADVPSTTYHLDADEAEEGGPERAETWAALAPWVEQLRRGVGDPVVLAEPGLLAPAPVMNKEPTRLVVESGRVHLTHRDPNTDPLLTLSEAQVMRCMAPLLDETGLKVLTPELARTDPAEAVRMLETGLRIYGRAGEPRYPDLAPSVATYLLDQADGDLRSRALALLEHVDPDAGPAFRTDR